MIGRLVATIKRWHMKTLKPFGKLASPPGLWISLGDLDPKIACALAESFANFDQVEVVQGNLLDLNCDAILSPGNSFGDMGGGIDKAIDDFHKGKAQKAVMAAIGEHFLGELPVGAALVVDLASRRFPFVVAAPTMRAPGSAVGTIHAYLAMRAALVAVLKHNACGRSPIRSLAVPGLCTGVGGMDPTEAAEQMKAAFENVIGKNWQKVISPAMAPFAFRRPS